MSILLEAHKLVHGDRQATYGSPYECLKKTAEVFSALTGIPFSIRHVGTFNIVQKMVRDSFMQKRDNLVDIAGYAECMGLCEADSTAMTQTCAASGDKTLAEYQELPHQGHES